MKKIITTVLILGIIGLTGYFAYLVKAAQAPTVLSQEITAGSLSLTAPTGVTFGSKAYSFSGQTSSSNTLSNIQPADARGSQAGWDINVTCADWGGAGAMDYDGDGSTTGRLTINTASATCTVVSDGDLNGITTGATAGFGAAVTTITIISASNGNGDGNYDCDDFDLQQYIPGSQVSGTYTTTLTLDLQ